MVNLQELGDRLRQIRKQVGLTQKQLAAATRTTQTAISRLENGEEVNASMFAAILSYFSRIYSLNYIFSDDFDITSHHLRLGSRDEIRQQLERLIRLF